VLPPKALHRKVPDVVIPHGNHGASSASLPGAPMSSDIEVFHYPARSYPQFEHKVRNGGSSYARNREPAFNQGFHKRCWCDQRLRGELEREFGEKMFSDKHRLRCVLDSGEILLDCTVAERGEDLP
jgi:hypothetical protein